MVRVPKATTGMPIQTVSKQAKRNAPDRIRCRAQPVVGCDNHHREQKNISLFGATQKLDVDHQNTE